jgi:minor histocompatibility antigen H13
MLSVISVSTYTHAQLRYVPMEYVNIGARVYFCLLGVLVMQTQASYVMHSAEELIAQGEAEEAGDVMQESDVMFLWIPYMEVRRSFTIKDMYALVFSLVVALWYTYNHHWLPSNLLGICFAVQGIELIQIGSFQNAVMLLAGLFLYDIFWVFGTDVMVRAWMNDVWCIY